MKKLYSTLIFSLGLCSLANGQMTLLSDNFDDLTQGSVTRTNGHLRGNESGPAYYVGGSAADHSTGVFTVVDASSFAGGNFSGNALQFNYSTNNRFLYVPFTNPGWNNGDKLALSFDFIYTTDPTNNATSLWTSMMTQGVDLATGDFDRALTSPFSDDSGHSLKLAESNNPITSYSYAFSNGRITSGSGNFYTGGSGILPYLQSTTQGAHVTFELERVADAIADPQTPGTFTDGTMLRVYINGALIDQLSSPTALIPEGGSLPYPGGYDSFAIWARAGGAIDNLSLTYTAVPEPSAVALFLGITAFGCMFFRRKMTPK